MYDAIFFDLDGTLLYTLQDIADSMNHALAELHLPEYPVQAYKTMVGDGMKTLCQRAVHGDEALRDQLIPLYQAQYSAHLADTTRPYDGIAEALHALSAAGVKLFVLSNKPDRDTKSTIAHYFPCVNFAEVLGQRPEFPVKPDPAACRYLLARHGLNANRCAMVGDSRNDVMLGVNAGLFPVGALWGYRDEGELVAGGAKMLLHKPEELCIFAR